MGRQVVMLELDLKPVPASLHFMFTCAFTSACFVMNFFIDMCTRDIKEY